MFTSKVPIFFSLIILKIENNNIYIANQKYTKLNYNMIIIKQFATPVQIPTII